MSELKNWRPRNAPAKAWLAKDSLTDGLSVNQNMVQQYRLFLHGQSKRDNIQDANIDPLRFKACLHEPVSISPVSRTGDSSWNPVFFWGGGGGGGGGAK
jgi:hypothetical protein